MSTAGLWIIWSKQDIVTENTRFINVISQYSPHHKKKVPFSSVVSVQALLYILNVRISAH